MITAIKYFLEVVNTGNFTRAAWNLKLAPSIITKKIKQLEDRLGYKLFYRTTRKVVLTPEGQLFLKKADALVNNYDHLFDAVDSKALTPVIRIACGYLLSKLFLIRFLPEFSMKYPKIKFEFVQDNSPVQVAQDDIDIAIGAFLNEFPNMVKTSLFESKRRLFAAPSYIAQYGIPKKIEDLSQHNCLVNLLVHPDKKWYFDGKEVTIDPKICTDEGSILVDAALQGLGIINCAEEIILCYVNSGQLIPLKMPVDEERTNISMVHQKLPKEHIIRQFADFISKKAKSLIAANTRKG